MKNAIAMALCAVTLMAAAPAAAGIIKVIAENGDVMYLDTGSGETHAEAAGQDGAVRAWGADSTIGFRSAPPSAGGSGTPTASTGGGGGGCTKTIAGSEGWTVPCGSMNDSGK